MVLRRVRTRVRPSRHLPQRFLAVILLLAVVVTGVAYGAATSLSPANAKAALQDHGIGHMVVIRQVDGSRLRAKILTIGESSVTVRAGSRPDVEISYSTLAKVQDGGLPKAGKIAIVVGIILIALGIIGTRV